MPVIVIPTYNERDNVAPLLARIQAAVPEAHVLFVDDSSPDGTGDLVATHPDYGSRIFLLRRPVKAGLGAAYRAGFAWAMNAGYASIIQMDADLSHPPERIPAMLAALDDADLAVGSRYVRGGGVTNWPASRRFISWGGNVYVRTVLGLRVRDITAGFKAWRSSALDAIDVGESHSNGYCFQIENTWQAARRGLVVTEVPITFTDRTEGHSKMSGSIVREALWRVLAWRLRRSSSSSLRPGSSAGSTTSPVRT